MNTSQQPTISYFSFPGMPKKDFTASTITAFIAEKYKLTVDHLKSPDNSFLPAQTRHLVVYVLWLYREKIFNDINAPLQLITVNVNRHRTTGYYSIKTIADLMSTEPAFNLEVKQLIDEIKMKFF